MILNSAFCRVDLCVCVCLYGGDGDGENEEDVSELW